METTVIDTKCPHCQKKLDRSVGDDQPKTGDITVCLYCLDVSVYNDDLSLYIPDGDTLKQYRQMNDVIRAQNLIKLGNMLRNTTNN